MSTEGIQAPLVEFDTGQRTRRIELDEDVFAPTAFAKLLSGVLEPRIVPGMQVCELGVGSGVLSVLAGLKGAKVVGLDVNAAAIDLARRNWLLNGLDKSACDFRHSDRFSELTAQDEGAFDIIFSNPPVLPDITVVATSQSGRAKHEVNGPEGRNVLDAMLQDAGRYLKAGGVMYTIATSLQGWERTQSMLAQHWPVWSILDEQEILLTDECGPEYIRWWRAQEQQGSERYLSDGEGAPLHKLWFIAANKT